MISRSVAQIATASMRTRTSARLGTGTGFSESFSSPGLPRTQAFILSGTGKSALVFTPGPAYMVASFGRFLWSLLSGRPSPALIMNFSAERNGLSRRLAGSIALGIDVNVAALQHDLVGAQRNLAGRRLHRSGRDMEGAEMHTALDHVAFQHAVGKACRGMGAFVVGDVELAADIVDREP